MCPGCVTWIDTNFSTREPDFYKKLFQSHDDNQDKDTFKTFQVPIGNAKVVKSFVFHKDAPILSYCQKTLNCCCFSSLSSAFDSSKHVKAANAIYICIKESFKSEVGNHIDFANEIMLKGKRNEGEARVHYKLIKYKKMGDYNILEDISADVTLVQLIDSLGNVNHAISVVGSWIFDSNYERALILNKASLDMICAPYVGEEQDSIFKKKYDAVRYIFNEAKLK